jgi:tripartite-type tricarboxylate transporter receptor subunit TctC
MRIVCGPQVRRRINDKIATWEDTMSSRTWLRAGLLAVAGAAALMFATPVLAVYPERPITLVVPFAAGGPTDIISRLMAEPMSRALGQQVIV